MSLRDRIIAADDIGKRLVEVPEWGVTVEVRTISAGQRSQMLKSAQDGGGGVDVDKLYPMLLIATCFDPDEDEVPDISGRDLVLLEGLNARDAGITDLSGLECAQGLRTLGLGGNELSDLSVLRALPGLQELELSGNGLDDLSVVGELTQLTRLCAPPARSLCPQRLLRRRTSACGRDVFALS